MSGRNGDMCVRTRCRTVDELVALFGRYLEGNSLFVATLGTRGEGFEAVFTIALVDGVIALRGRGVIEKAWTNAENPFRLPGILIAVRTLTASSKALFDRIRAERDRNVGNTAPLTRVPVPLADILSGAEFARWKDEETLIGPPLAEHKVAPSKVPIPALPARTKSATIPPLPPRTVTPIIKGTISRPVLSVPPIAPHPPIAKPPMGTPPIARTTIEAPTIYRVLATATPTPDQVPDPNEFDEPEAATQLDLRENSDRLAVSRGSGAGDASDASDAAERAPTIPKLELMTTRRMSWWARVLLVLLPIAGFAGGAMLAETTARPAVVDHARPTKIPVHGTIEIDGTRYTVDVVLTAQRL